MDTSLQLPMPIPKHGWVPREMHRELVRMMYENNLLTFHTERTFPLKKGGKTDIFVNVRLVRSFPAMIPVLAKLYAHPLRWINADLFADVPDAISPLCGHISAETGKPYVTIRKEPKEGRVSDANIVGSFKSSDSVVIIDDVITDGASKIGPIAVCREKGLVVKAILPLVDRQDGWQENFQEIGMDVPVWAGLTLHDVRRELISLGLMRRANPELEEDNPIIVALDGQPWEKMQRIADVLRPTGCIFKVNDVLVEEGLNLLPELSAYGRIMVDLKLHDIPQTVENVCRRMRNHPPWAITVHASGGRKMVESARRGLGNAPTKILAVTILTSFTPSDCDKIYHRRPLIQVGLLANEVSRAGADGFVCSPREGWYLRKHYKKMLIVTPGVRPLGSAKGDQKRTATPEYAISHGANYVVIGRPITGAKKPLDAMTRILIENGLM